MPEEKKEGSAGEGHNSSNVDWAKAAKLIKGEILNIDDKAAKLRGDMSAVKKRLEELGVNKRGAKFVEGLLKAGDASASDILRTVCHLCHELDIGITKDMIDNAEDKKGFTIPLIETPSVDV